MSSKLKYPCLLLISFRNRIGVGTLAIIITAWVEIEENVKIYFAINPRTTFSAKFGLRGHETMWDVFYFVVGNP